MAAPAPQGESLSGIDAACRVLAEAGTPLHYREIAQRAMASGLWHTRASAPAHTMRALLNSHVVHYGDGSRVVRTAHGMFCLREQASPPPAAPLPTPARSPLDELGQPELESLASALLHALGFEGLAGVRGGDRVGVCVITSGLRVPFRVRVRPGVATREHAQRLRQVLEEGRRGLLLAQAATADAETVPGVSVLAGESLLAALRERGMLP